MDLKEKVAQALDRFFEPDHIRLLNDDGVYGYVVSSRFQKMAALDRAKLIDQALRKSSPKLTKAELREVMAIAALTPVEYAALGYEEKKSRR